MLEHSKCFRTGRIVKVSPVMQNRQNNMPYVLVELTSRIQIDVSETIEEATNVLLIGDACVEWWKQITPPPGPNDGIRLNYVTAYVKNGRLCCRVTDPSSIEVVLAQTSEKTQEKKESKPAYESMHANDFFKQIAEKKEKENL